MSLGNGSQGHPQSSLEELVFFFISFYFRHFLGMIYFRYFYPHGDLINDTDNKTLIPQADSNCSFIKGSASVKPGQHVIDG